MRGRFRVPMGVIAGGLLGLIALLATLQYRWLGQISGAERDRMTATLNSRATAFAQDVDRELTRAYVTFQLDTMQQDTTPVSRLVSRYAQWQATARFPRMVKDVYLVTLPEGEGWGPLQRLDPTTRFLEPVEWPAALAGVRGAIEKTSSPPEHTSAATPGTASFVMRSTVANVWAGVPAVVIPAPLLIVSHLDTRTDPRLPPVRMSSGFRYTILQLDRDYLKNEMLPALAQQHFQGTGDGFDYQLAVVPVAGGEPVYHSVSDFVPAANANADARVEMFQVRVKDFEPLVSEVTRFATFTAAPDSNGVHSQRTVRQAMNGPANVTIGSTPMSIIIQNGTAVRGEVSSSGTASGTAQQRIGAMLNGAAAAFGTRSTGPAVAAPWRLLVKHPSGSLEHAVNAARWRNLVVSSSILGILGLSVGFLIVSTRRAQDLARQQLEFVATVSHELRTPLAVIRSAADNLADGVVDDEARIRQYGQLVRREGLRLTDLVEQILEYAGLQSGQRTLMPKPVAIAALLHDVAATAESTAQSRVSIELSVADNLPAVAGDEPALRRVFQNLVGNALKYGADAGWVGIHATASGSNVEVSVADRGIGIAAADQPRIFDPFYRAPEVVAAQIQGAGLGLSLVKRIVEAHGGRVTLTSAPGEGSTFTVTLPVADGESADGRDRVGEVAAQPL